MSDVRPIRLAPSFAANSWRLLRAFFSCSGKRARTQKRQRRFFARIFFCLFRLQIFSLVCCCSCFVYSRQGCLGNFMRLSAFYSKRKKNEVNVLSKRLNGREKFLLSWFCHRHHATPSSEVMNEDNGRSESHCDSVTWTAKGKFDPLPMERKTSNSLHTATLTDGSFIYIERISDTLHVVNRAHVEHEICFIAILRASADGNKL